MSNSGTQVFLFRALIGTVIGICCWSLEVKWPGSVSGDTACVVHTEVNIAPQLKDDPEVVKGWHETIADIRKIDTGKVR
jgi:hypothetical protein